MFDPASTFQQPGRQRKGAVLPLFAFLFPVLLILCGFAINLAYMQKVNTEMKVSTDAAAHAGGRAMSIHQTTDAAIAQAEVTAQANKVAGHTVSVLTTGSEDDDVDVRFGVSTRSNNGYGMYEYVDVPKASIDNGSDRATSVAVTSSIELPLVFRVMNFSYFSGNLSDFTSRRRSIATQVDRDIALVLDRSGSMLYYQDETDLTDTLYDLYNTYDTITTPAHWEYAYWEWSNYYGWQWRGYYAPENANASWTQDPNDKQWTGETTSTERRISWSEYDDATQFLYYRTYSNNVIYQLERLENPSHTLGDSFSSSESSQLTIPKAQYTRDWQYSSTAARYSRWYFLDLGVTAFLDVLEFTDQEELVSLVTFSNSSSLDHSLQEVYDPVRTTVGNIIPNGATAIGEGLLEGLPPIISGSAARPFAAKTIVVLTDGVHNTGVDPATAVSQIIGQHAVTIHTVTFTAGADKPAMQAVAVAGFGKHYHADDGQELIQVFEEIANNLPTILTE